MRVKALSPGDAGDPLVPVRGDRVSALIDARGLSRRRVAAACGTKEQNLAPIVKGKQQRCRASLLRALTRVLRPPGGAKYLTGEADLLPGEGSAAGFDSLGRFHVQKSSDVPAYELALHDLVAATRRALKREYAARVRAGEGLPIGGAARYPVREKVEGGELESWPVGPTDPREVYAPLLSLENWRAFIFGDSDSAPVSLSETEEIEFARLMAGAMRVLLQPWFDGDQTIRGMSRATERVAKHIYIQPVTGDATTIDEERLAASAGPSDQPEAGDARSSSGLVAIPETVTDDYWLWDLLRAVGEEVQRWPARGTRLIARLDAEEKRTLPHAADDAAETAPHGSSGQRRPEA
jgi:hypothetical protein